MKTYAEITIRVRIDYADHDLHALEEAIKSIRRDSHCTEICSNTFTWKRVGKPSVEVLT